MRLWTVLAAVCCLLLAVDAARAQDPTGTWTGTVDQPGWGSYGVVMRLESDQGGTTDYPDIPCSGSLSGGGSGGVYTFTETITAYRDKCVDNGRIRFVVQGDNAYWEWTGSQDGVSYFASGTLHRATSSTGRASCGECGIALLNDLAAGLGQSAQLRSYVDQSLAKYDNCVRPHGDACANQCGFQARANIPACSKWDEQAGYRACVETTYNGAALECQR